MAHFPNKIFADFGLGYEQRAYSASQDLVTAAQLSWFAAHIDVREQLNGGPPNSGTTGRYSEDLLRSYNTNLLWWSYGLDLTAPDYDPVGQGQPENYYLHVSNFCRNDFHHSTGVVTTTNMSPGNRLTLGMINSARYVYNLKDAACRAWLKGRLLTAMQESGPQGARYLYLYLDQHGGSFVDAMRFYSENAWPNGLPLLTEYGDIGPSGGVTTEPFESAYQADVVAWLQELRTYLAATGRRVIVNAVESMMNDDTFARDQHLAAGGCSPEFVVGATGIGFKEYWRTWRLYTFCQSLYDGGGLFLTTGRWGSYYDNRVVNIDQSPDVLDRSGQGGGVGVRTRIGMHRLGAYYLLRHNENQASAFGAACWFDATLPSYYEAALSDIDLDQVDYLPAWTYDLGVPKLDDGLGGAMYEAYSAVSIENAAYRSVVFGRRYTHGLVLLRGQDGDTWQAGDSSAVTVTLPVGTWNRLKWDGTTTAVVGSTIAVRQWESIVLTQDAAISIATLPRKAEFDVNLLSADEFTAGAMVWAYGNSTPRPPNPPNFWVGWNSYVTPPGSSASELIDTEYYYEAAHVFHGIADYTGDSQWTLIARKAALWYLNYVETLDTAKYAEVPPRGGLAAQFILPVGLYLEWQRNPDSVVRARMLKALYALANDVSFGTSYPANFTPDLYNAREVSYNVYAKYLALQAGYQTTYGFAPWGLTDDALIGWSYAFCDQAISLLQGGNGGLDLTGSPITTNHAYVRPFMMANLAQGLIIHFENTGDVRVLPKLQMLFDLLWTVCYSANGVTLPNTFQNGQPATFQNFTYGRNSFTYTEALHAEITDTSSTGLGAVPMDPTQWWEFVPGSFKPPDASSIWPTPELNGLILPIYFWLYQQTGNTLYRDRADLLFDGLVYASDPTRDYAGFAPAYFNAGKVFNQMYSRIWPYVTAATTTPPVNGTIISANTTGLYVGTFGGVEDTSLRQDNPSGDLSLQTWIDVYKQNANNHGHGLLRFSGLTNIPANALVTRVELGCYVANASGAGDQTIDLRRLLRNWVNGQATWLQYATGQAWSTNGAIGDGTDRIAAVSGTLTPINETFGWRTIVETSGPLLNDVQMWISGAQQNCGWHLERGGAGDDGTWRVLTSSETAGTDIRPYLTVTFTLPVSNVWTSVKSGSWQDPTVWDHGDGTTPQAGNRAVLAFPHVVTLNADQSVGDSPGGTTSVLDVHGTLELNGFALYASGNIECFQDGNPGRTAIHGSAGSSLFLYDPIGTQVFLDCNGCAVVLDGIVTTHCRFGSRNSSGTIGVPCHLLGQYQAAVDFGGLNLTYTDLTDLNDLDGRMLSKRPFDVAGSEPVKLFSALINCTLTRCGTWNQLNGSLARTGTVWPQGTSPDLFFDHGDGTVELLVTDQLSIGIVDGTGTIVPSVALTSKTASDSLGLQGAESRANPTETIAGQVTGIVLTLTEARAVVVQTFPTVLISATDSLALSTAATPTSLTIILTATESLAPHGLDLVIATLTPALQDTLALPLSDLGVVAPLLTPISATDSLLLGATEAMAVPSILELRTPSDALILGATDASLIAASLVLADSLAVPASDSIAPSVSYALVDSLTLTTVDITTAMSVLLTASDTLVLTLTEILAPVNTLTVAETAICGLTDVAIATVFHTVTDALLLGLTDATPTIVPDVVPLAIADSLVVGMTDSAVVATVIGISAAETLILAGTDAAALDTTQSAAEAVLLGLSDQQAIVQQAFTISEILAISVDGVTTAVATLTVADSLALEMSETVSDLSIIVAAIEIVSLTLTDSATSAPLGGQTDALLLGLTDVMALMELFLTTVDAIGLSGSETVTSAAVVTGLDQSAVQLAEIATEDGAFNLVTAQDTDVIGLAADATALFLDLTVRDSLRAGLDDIGFNLDLELLGVITLLTFTVAADQASVGSLATGTTNASLAAREVMALHLTDRFGLQLQAPTLLDQAGLSLTETASIVESAPPELWEGGDPTTWDTAQPSESKYTIGPVLTW